MTTSTAAQTTETSVEIVGVLEGLAADLQETGSEQSQALKSRFAQCCSR